MPTALKYDFITGEVLGLLEASNEKLLTININNLNPIIKVIKNVPNVSDIMETPSKFKVQNNQIINKNKNQNGSGNYSSNSDCSGHYRIRMGIHQESRKSTVVCGNSPCGYYRGNQFLYLSGYC